MHQTLMKFGGYAMDDDGELRVGKNATFEHAGLTGQWLSGVGRHHQRWQAQWFDDIQQRFPESYTQLIPSHLNEETLAEYSRVIHKVPHWEPTQSFSKHQSVAALTPDAQRKILTKARDEGLTLPEVRQEVRKAKHRTKAKGVASGAYKVGYLNPAWGKGTVKALTEFPLMTHLQEDAAVFLWVDERYRDDVIPVFEAWGVRRVGTFIWNTQLAEGPSSYMAVKHKYLVWLVRGQCTPDTLVPMVDSVVSIKAVEPGVPPEKFREIIDRLYDGRKVEFGARYERTSETWSFIGRKEAAA